MPILDLSGPRGLFQCVDENYRDLWTVDDDARHLINCAVLAHHMLDWVHKAWIERFPDRQKLLGIRGSRLEDFREWVASKCGETAVLRDLADGVKHLELSSPARRPSTASATMGTAMIAAGFPNHERLYSVTIGGREHALFWRGAGAGSVLSEVVEFWRRFVREHENWGE